MHVLGQGVKTGVYRVCDELFPRLARSPHFDSRLFIRQGLEEKAESYLAASPRLQELGVVHHIDGNQLSERSDILLSPFAVAPPNSLLDPRLLHAHIVYDLIAINRPDFFGTEAASEVRAIVDSIDQDTVVFAISECTKRDLLKQRPDLNPQQVTVIPLAAGNTFCPCDSAVARSAVRLKYGIPADVPFALSLATLEIRKNLEQVVNAFVLFLERTKDSQMHLVLSGMSGWKLEQLQDALAAAQKWRHRIILTGFVEDCDLSALYSDALCFLYLSRYEGFGLPPLEAMSCGTPVICSNNSSLPEVVGTAGLMFDADDTHGVAEALLRMDCSADLRIKLAEAGLQRAKLFSWDNCAEIVADTLHKAYERHHRRPANRSGRVLSPGQLVTNARRSDGFLEANFLDYRNGSLGPRFTNLVSPPTRKIAHQPVWPFWKDRLQARPTTKTVEGGLRIQGVFRSGTQDQPLVSYVTVVRNNTATLARTIESVQRQTYPNVEHIILDGNSSDGTLDLIREFADRIDYFASEADDGLYDAVNKAIPLARGQLICILNSDDWLEPDAAEIAVHRMRRVAGPAILLSSANVQSEDTSIEWSPAFVHPGCYFKCANDCHNAIYATREAYERSGPYDTSYKIAADFKWIMACLDMGATFVYTKQATVNYSLGGVSSDTGAHSTECMRVASERFPGLTRREVIGLYDCFFLFSKISDLSDLPAERSTFLRELFANHANDADLLHAIAWASVEKLEYPFVAPVTKVRARSTHRVRKEAKRFARRLYSSIRKRV